MLWDTDSARRYDEWAESPKGNFALRRQEELLQRLLACWPRQRQKFLDIGCGTGIFLEFFWSCGFDVSGLDKSPDMLSRTREKMGDRAHLHLGEAGHLPFDDREFDYTSLMTVLEFVDDPALVLREAARVSRKGVLITFLNRFSLYRLSVRLSGRKSALSQARWFGWPEMRGLIHRNVHPGHMTARSVLPGPPMTWKPLPGLRYVNGLELFPWCGAVTAVRADLVSPAARTPLMAWNTEPT